MLLRMIRHEMTFEMCSIGRQLLQQKCIFKLGKGGERERRRGTRHQASWFLWISCGAEIRPHQRHVSLIFSDDTTIKIVLGVLIPTAVLLIGLLVWILQRNNCKLQKYSHNCSQLSVFYSNICSVSACNLTKHLVVTRSGWSVNESPSVFTGECLRRRGPTREPHELQRLDGTSGSGSKNQQWWFWVCCSYFSCTFFYAFFNLLCFLMIFFSFIIYQFKCFSASSALTVCTRDALFGSFNLAAAAQK